MTSKVAATVADVTTGTEIATEIATGTGTTTTRVETSKSKVV